jgi:hypothetical protein
LNLVPLAFARSRLAHDADRSLRASFDFLYLGNSRRWASLPSVRSGARACAAQHSGHVLERLRASHSNVWVFDFKALYQRRHTFNIDPLSYVETPPPGMTHRDARRFVRREPQYFRACSTNSFRAVKPRARPATRSLRNQNPHELNLQRARPPTLHNP